ncbi:MAG: hypothetical protein V4440_09690 [Pseudomonadota bacterium]
MSTLKFSEFDPVGALQSTDKLVGLRGSINAQFDAPVPSAPVVTLLSDSSITVTAANNGTVFYLPFDVSTDVTLDIDETIDVLGVGFSFEVINASTSATVLLTGKTMNQVFNNGGHIWPVTTLQSIKCVAQSFASSDIGNFAALAALTPLQGQTYQNFPDNADLLKEVFNFSQINLFPEAPGFTATVSDVRGDPVTAVFPITLGIPHLFFASDQIYLNDNADNLIYNFAAGDFARITLLQNDTAAGTWLVEVLTVGSATTVLGGAGSGDCTYYYEKKLNSVKISFPRLELTAGANSTINFATPLPTIIRPAVGAGFFPVPMIAKVNGTNVQISFFTASNGSSGFALGVNQGVFATSDTIDIRGQTVEYSLT